MNPVSRNEASGPCFHVETLEPSSATMCEMLSNQGKLVVDINVPGLQNGDQKRVRTTAQYRRFGRPSYGNDRERGAQREVKRYVRAAPRTVTGNEARVTVLSLVLRESDCLCSRPLFSSINYLFITISNATDFSLNSLTCVRVNAVNLFREHCGVTRTEGSQPCCSRG